MKKKFDTADIVLLGILAICIMAVLVFVLGNHDDKDFRGYPNCEMSYTDSEGNTCTQNLGVVGYNWDGDVSQPDGCEKVLPCYYDHTVPNISSVTLEFSETPDGLTIYGFGPEFAYSDRLFLDKATSVTELDLASVSREKVILDFLISETTYLVKASFGDEYLYYMIPMTDEDLTVHLE